MQSNNIGHAAALGVTTPVPPAAAIFLALPTALTGSLSVTAPAGWSGGSDYVLPAGTPAGLYRCPFGAADRISTVTLSSGTDASSGAFVACAAGTPVPPAYPAGQHFAQHDQVWPWFGGAAGAALGRVQASFLASKSGGLGLSFASGLVAIRTPLRGSLTLTGPGGYSQTLAAGSVGVIALTGPTGAGCTFVFSNPDDWSEANTVLVTGQIA